MTKTNTQNGIHSHQFHKFYLKITAILVASFGPICAIGAIEGFSEPARWTLYWLALYGVGLFNFIPNKQLLSCT